MSSHSRDPLVALFDGLAVALLSDASDKLSLPDSVLHSSVHAVVGTRMAGRASTLNRVRRPANVTQDQAAPQFKSALHEIIDEALPGTVLVVATQGDAEVALWGGNMANRAKAAGVAGLVTDGAVRDIAETEEIGLNVFAQTVTPRGGGYRHYLTIAKNEPVICGGVYIRAGDIVIGDRDGVIVIDPANADAIASGARKLQEGEAAAQAAVKQGASLISSNASFRK